MNQENNNKFNIDILMNDVNNVIQNGVNNLLSDFITNYKLYEETHNCIMNLPSVKREIAKNNEVNETYNDLPDLISISSDDSHNLKNDYSNYVKTSLEDESEDSDQESDDTLLCMKKVANQLLKEKEDTIALYQKEEKFYKEIIENCYKEIEDLKNELKNCIKSHLVCDLTDDLEITQEKENIMLHIEEKSEQEDEEDEEEEDEEEDEEEEEEDKEEEVNSVKSEKEEEEVTTVKSEEDEEEVNSVKSEKEEEEVTTVKSEEDEKDEVETEKSDSDEESQEALEEKEEEEEEELIEIEIDDITYCTNNEDNGLIYELDKDGNVGETVGYLKDGEPFFN